MAEISWREGVKDWLGTSVHGPATSNRSEKLRLNFPLSGRPGGPTEGGKRERRAAHQLPVEAVPAQLPHQAGRRIRGGQDDDRLRVALEEPRGERGLLSVSAAHLTRLRCNPFFPYVERRLMEFEPR